LRVISHQKSHRGDGTGWTCRVWLVSGFYTKVVLMRSDEILIYVSRGAVNMLDKNLFG